MTSGLILLVLLGALVGFGWSRVRRKMGMGMTWGSWLSVIAGVVVLGLALWAFSAKH